MHAVAVDDVPGRRREKAVSDAVSGFRRRYKPSYSPRCSGKQPDLAIAIRPEPSPDRDDSEQIQEPASELVAVPHEDPADSHHRDPESDWTKTGGHHPQDYRHATAPACLNAR